jgi:Putative Actinobacterial Holin-X, holin superfamily III
VADNPQQTVRELKELVIAYAKQETADPLKGLGRFVGFGVGGALLMGTGFCFLAIGLLRALEGNRGWLVHGNWSWVPYAIDVLGLLAIAALVWMARSSRSQRKKKRSKTQ